MLYVVVDGEFSWIVFESGLLGWWWIYRVVVVRFDVVVVVVVFVDGFFGFGVDSYWGY